MSPHPSAPDLTPLFNWNTKQVFLYLEADYTNAQGVIRVNYSYEYMVRQFASSSSAGEMVDNGQENGAR
jgi:Signal peptidase subunit